jgi:hypothetical protein
VGEWLKPAFLKSVVLRNSTAGSNPALSDLVFENYTGGTFMAITTEEKIKLMRDIGMTEGAAKLENEIETKKMIDEMTGMKFPVTSVEKIRKQICGWYWQSPFEGTIYPEKFLIGLFFLLTFGLPFLFCFKRADLEDMNLAYWGDRIPVGALYAVKEAQEKGIRDFRIYFPVTEHQSRMKDPVIVGFVYPKKKEVPPEERMQSSLRIMGALDNLSRLGGMVGSGIAQQAQMTGGVMVEVFAWDDGVAAYD